jgi:hypothetical protein
MESGVVKLKFSNLAILQGLAIAGICSRNELLADSLIHAGILQV